MTARRKSLRQVVAEGDQRASLEAIRDVLAARLQNAAASKAPALARELRMVLDKLEALPGGGEVTPLDRIESAVVDELADRRAHRSPDAASS